jgi:hypothetical protein
VTLPVNPTLNDAVPCVPLPVHVHDLRIVAAVQWLPEPQTASARLTVMPMLTPPMDFPGTIAVEAGLGSDADAVAGASAQAVTATSRMAIRRMTARVSGHARAEPR